MSAMVGTAPDDRLEPVSDPPGAAGAVSRRAVEALLVVVAAVSIVLKNDAAALSLPGSRVAGNRGDPLYFAWQMSWVAHAVTHDISQLWTTNAFLRAPGNLAYT